MLCFTISILSIPCGCSIFPRRSVRESKALSLYWCFISIFQPIRNRSTRRPRLTARASLKYLSVSLCLAGAAVILSLLFSFVWYWNETYQSNLLFGGKLTTLPLKLQSFTTAYQTAYGDGTAASNPNMSVVLAGTLLSVLPMIVLYIAAQKQFITSIEQSGITGE